MLTNFHSVLEMAVCDINVEFWKNLMMLKKELEAIDNTNKMVLKGNNSEIYKTQNSINRNEMLLRIEKVVESLLKELAAGEPMKFCFNKRGHSNNIRFNERVGMQMADNTQMTVISIDNESSFNKFAVMMRVLSQCYQLLQSNSYTTKRDLYYGDKSFFGSQQVIDEAFNDLACMLQVPRSSLHVFASPKGCVIGNLVFKDEEGNYIDCSHGTMGVMVPAHVDAVHDFHSKAKFVLLVEKEASFQKLNDDNILTKLGPCIMITAKGFPDVNTRIFIKKIWEDLKIPVLALVDADPHGIEIMCVYRFGSKSMAFDAENLTCPFIRWIGVLPTDMRKYNIPKEALIQTSKVDEKKMFDLLKRPYIIGNNLITEQIEGMISQGHKAEIECLDAISSSFATDVYLPFKIRSGDWI